MKTFLNRRDNLFLLKLREFFLAQNAVAENFGQNIQSLLVRQTQMRISAEKLFDQKIIKKLHLSRRKNDCRIDAFAHVAAPDGFIKFFGENAAEAFG
jgi:hypothetical protein